MANRIELTLQWVQGVVSFLNERRVMILICFDGHIVRVLIEHVFNQSPMQGQWMTILII